MVAGGKNELAIRGFFRARPNFEISMISIQFCIEIIKIIF